MRRTVVLPLLVLLAAGCSSTVSGAHRSAKDARAILPRIHEGFTLLPCPHTEARGTTLGMEGCAEHNILRTDRKIMATEGAVFSLLPAEGRSAFARAERSWLLYRRAFCNARSSSYKGGSIAPGSDQSLP